MYDGVLNLEWPDKVTAFAYADDLVALVEAVDARDLMFKTNSAGDAFSLDGRKGFMLSLSKVRGGYTERASHKTKHPV